MTDALRALFFDHLIYYAAYLVIFIGVAYGLKTMFETELRVRFAAWKNLTRYRQNGRPYKQQGRFHTSRNRFTRHLFLLFESTAKQKGNPAGAVYMFLLLSTMLLLGSWIVLYVNMGDWFIAGLFAVLFASVPYMLKQLQIRSIRHSVGNDLLPVIQQLNQNYTAQRYDMYHTLYHTASNIDNKQLRNVFYKLVSDMQVHRSENDLREVLDVFIYTCGNSWAIRLANNILKSYVYDRNVMHNLTNLVRKMEETEEMLAEEKSHAMTPVMLGYMVLPLFVLSLFLGYFVSGPQSWTALQFGESWTVLSFTVALSLSLFGFLTALFLRKPKNDV